MDIYQCLKLGYSDRLSSFFTKLPKNNIGVSQGVSDTLHDASMLFLSTKWVDYVEEPMKYQALRSQFFSMGGWWGGGGGGGVCGEWHD